MPSPVPALLLGLLLAAGGCTNQPAMPGSVFPKQADLDAFMAEAMQKYHLPGGSVAVSKDGRLVYARGYGYADREVGIPATANTLFRIASTSKALTGVAVLKLVEQGRIGLDDKMVDLLPDLKPFPGKTADPRLATVTLRHLLTHSAGFPTADGDDPQMNSTGPAASVGMTAPLSQRSIIRYVMGRPLLFDPGSQYLYSNVGYNILARIIEAATGQRYEDHLQALMLRPMGVRRMQIGHTFAEMRAQGEARYYGQPEDVDVPSTFPGLGLVPAGYGEWSHPVIDGHGGWIASSVDLLRFARGVAGDGGVSAYLAPATIALMTQDPKLPGGNPRRYYGLGWNIEHKDQGTDWSHAGGLLGSNSAYLKRQANGISYAVAFNAIPTDYDGFFGQFLAALQDRVNAASWPSVDRFADFE